jgi:hypothetical protein
MGTRTTITGMRMTLMAMTTTDMSRTKARR